LKNTPTLPKDVSLVGAAVGVKGDDLERTENLLNNDIIVVDIAHGHMITQSIW